MSLHTVLNDQRGLEKDRTNRENRKSASTVSATASPAKGVSNRAPFL